MVASHAVRPVDDSIHQPLKPHVVRDKVFILEQTRSPQSPNLRQHPLNHLLSCPNLLRQRAPEPFIVQKLLLVTRKPLVLTEPQNTDVCVREKLLRVLTKQQDSCRPWLPLTVDKISRLEGIFRRGRSNDAGVLLHQLHIKIVLLNTRKDRRVILLLTFGVSKFKNAVGVKLPRLITDSQITIPRL